jgi:hypothetical protein
MRALIVTLLLLGFLNSSFAQNKTFGIGTVTPNPNAVLHVESPTGNQGFIMPRLTTAQRNAMAALPLTGGEEGMMVYDKDQKKIYIWNGSAWALPAKYSITDPNSVDTALTAVTYSNKPHGFAVSGIHKGTGDAAGFFLVDNVTSSAPALYAEHRGTGPAIMGGKWVTNGSAGVFMNGNNTNDAATLFVQSNSNTANASTFTSIMTGTGGNAASFNIGNPVNNMAGIYSTTSGTGAAVMGETGTGFASVFGKHNGAGNAGNFESTNSGNPNAALWVQSNSAVAPAIQINHTGGGNAINANRPIQATYFVGDGSLLTNLPGGGGGGWALTGNSGTVVPTNFLGTTDNNDLLFRTNNTDRFLIGKSGGLTVLNSDINMSGGKAIGLSPASDFFTSPVGNFGNYGLGWVSDAWQGSGATAYLSGWGGIKMFTFSTGTSRLAINTFGLVGINNDNPAAQLDINGDVLLQPIGAPGVVTDKLYNVGGSLYWNGANISAGGSGWALSGNSLGGSEAIGSTNAQPLAFKTNNVEQMRIDPAGKVGIGTSTPGYKLDVAGTTQVVNTFPGLRAMEIVSTVGDGVNITASGTVNTKAITATATATGNYATGVNTTATADVGQIAMGVQASALGSGSINFGVQANATGPAITNYGVYGSAFNASSANWAGYFDNGNVHIKNALSFGTTDGTYGTPGQIVKSQGGAAAPVWSDLYPQTTGLSSSSALLDLTNSGAGMAANFTANTGMAANFNSGNASQSINVVNSGSGRAGVFNSSGSGNPALQAQNSGAGGTALSLFQSSNGTALNIQQGGIVYASLVSISTSGSYGRAVIYDVTASGATVTLNYGPLTGESIYVYTPNGVTFDGLSLSPSSTAIYNLIYVAGGWRRVQ